MKFTRYQFHLHGHTFAQAAESESLYSFYKNNYTHNYISNLLAKKVHSFH